MIRPVLLTGALLVFAGGAQAQAFYEDPGRYNALMMQAELAQRDALAAQQAADAARMRYETETRLGALAAQRTAADGSYRPTMVLGTQIGAQMTQDSERLAELTDQALARGNARIVAVKPVVR